MNLGNDVVIAPPAPEPVPLPSVAANDERTDLPASVVAEVKAPVASAYYSKETSFGFHRASAVVTDIGPVVISDERYLGKDMKFWNGQTFLPGKIAKSAIKSEGMVSVVCSDGQQLILYKDYPVLLHDGTTVPACELRLNDKLKSCTMPTYPGDDNAGNSYAFMLGYVYGTGLAQSGADIPVFATSARFTIPYLLVPLLIDSSLREEDPVTGQVTETVQQVKNPVLTYLQYSFAESMKFAKENNIDFDSDKNALIIVPKSMINPEIPVNAPVKDRRMFCAGVAAATKKNSTIISARANVAAYLQMVCGVSKKCKMVGRMLDSDGRWGTSNIPVPKVDTEFTTMDTVCPSVVSIAKYPTQNACTLYTVDGLTPVDGEEHPRVIINNAWCLVVRDRPREDWDPPIVVDENGNKVDFD